MTSEAVAVRLEPLRTATTDQAEQFFAEVDAVELVTWVRAATDDELLDLLGREEVRPAAVAGLMARLHEYAVPEQLHLVTGVVRFDLMRRGLLLERHALRIEAGSMTPVNGVTEQTHVDVVLTTSLLRFVRIVSGELNAGLAFLGGQLDIDGNAELALGIGGLFRVPGSDTVAVDPRALDPVEVATVLKSVPADHLAKVMASEFRGVVLGEIFRRLPDFVNERKAKGVDLTIGLRLLGSPTGEIERYLVRVDQGAARVTEGDPGGDRDATITCEARDFLRLATGNLNAMTGVLRGQLKVRGDRAKALQLTSVLDIPSAK